MDSNSIIILKDYETSFNLSYQKIDKSLKEYREVGQSQQRDLKSEIHYDINNAKLFIRLMKMELPNLKEENNINKWQEIISNISSKYNECKEQLNKMEIQDIHKMNEFMMQNKIYACIDYVSIDYPLNRSGHKIKAIFKRCISDKLFLGMICLILLYTIVIVILYFFS